MKTRLCELCKEEASLYCLSDSAFLCLDCDSKVHGANFLVARHIRRIICSKCKEFDGNFISGNKIQFCKPICLSCSSDSDEENLDSSSSSSACISTIESLNSSDIKTKKIRFDLNKPAISDSDDSGDQSSFQGNVSVEEVPEKTVREKTEKSNGIAEGIFVNWIRRLGYNSNSHVLLQRASYALSVCLEKMTFLPFKVALASSFWFSLKYSRGRSMSTCQHLKRVEEICGVSAKLIVLIESKICRTLNLNRRSNKIMDTEEGWAEFSGR